MPHYASFVCIWKGLQAAFGRSSIPFVFTDEEVAKDDPGLALEVRYVREELSESASLPTSRLNNGIRRIDVTLPAVLVAELDGDILELGYFVSRSSVIEVAIRQFLDRSGVRSAAPGTVYR